MREPSSAPTEFVSYLDRRLRALESAALRLTGDDVQAERLVRELMTLVALRWRRLSRADARHELAAGESADAYLGKLFRQEASEYGYPRVGLNLDLTLPGQRRSTLAGSPSAQDEADLLWEVGRRRMRRRLLIAAGVGGVVAVGALCRPSGRSEESTEEPQQQLPLVQSTELPPGALILRGTLFGSSPIPGIAQQLKFPKEQGKPPQERFRLSKSPIPSAVLLASASDPYGGVFALADDGSWRWVDTAPFAASSWLTATSLSPDGRRAVFVSPTTAVAVELPSGRAQELPLVAGSAKPVWLGDQELLLGPDARWNFETGTLGPAPVGPEEVVTPWVPEAAQRVETLTELLPLGKPSTAPARVRSWKLGSPGSQAVTIPLNGPLAALVGWWHGAGFAAGNDRIARISRPRNLWSSLPVNAIVAVLHPKTGEVTRALLVSDGEPTLAGWRDERTVLFVLAAVDSQQLVAWDVLSDEVSLASTADFVGAMSLRDLSTVA